MSYSKGATVTANPTFILSAPSVNPQLTISTHGSAAQIIIDRDIGNCAVTSNPYRAGVGYIVVAPSGNKAIVLLRDYVGKRRTAQFYFSVVR